MVSYIEGERRANSENWQRESTEAKPRTIWPAVVGLPLTTTAVEARRARREVVNCIVDVDVCLGREVEEVDGGRQKESLDSFYTSPTSGVAPQSAGGVSQVVVVA